MMASMETTVGSNMTTTDKISIHLTQTKKSHKRKLSEPNVSLKGQLRTCLCCVTCFYFDAS